MSIAATLTIDGHLTSPLEADSPSQVLQSLPSGHVYFEDPVSISSSVLPLFRSVCDLPNTQLIKPNFSHPLNRTQLVNH